MNFSEALLMNASTINTPAGPILYSVALGPTGEYWNGYVRLPHNHLWKEMSEDEINDVFRSSEFIGYFPGGSGEITYKDNQGWIGFDTNHAADSLLGWTRESVKSTAKALAVVVGEFWQ